MTSIPKNFPVKPPSFDIRICLFISALQSLHDSALACLLEYKWLYVSPLTLTISPLGNIPPFITVEKTRISKLETDKLSLILGSATSYLAWGPGDLIDFTYPSMKRWRHCKDCCRYLEVLIPPGLLDCRRSVVGSDSDNGDYGFWADIQRVEKFSFTTSTKS